MAESGRNKSAHDWSIHACTIIDTFLLYRFKDSIHCTTDYNSSFFPSSPQFISIIFSCTYIDGRFFIVSFVCFSLCVL